MLERIPVKQKGTIYISCTTTLLLCSLCIVSEIPYLDSRFTVYGSCLAR